MKKINWFVIVSGVAVGIAAIVLTLLGNPANMGFCIACFERDIAGSLGLHSAAKVQYMRPEIIGLVLGSLIMSIGAREFRAKSGSSPATRFVLGMIVMVGGFRDLILFKDGTLLLGFAAIFVTVLVGNLCLGNFKLGFTGQPVAHSAWLWNFLGMLIAGWGSVLLGGCPLRQLILAGEGNGDSAVTVFGMITGAALAHNLSLAGNADSVNEAGEVVVGGIGTNGKVAVAVCIIVLLVVSLLNSRQKEAQ